jgi:uncharacterized protein YidB (DUF937 family)
MGLLDDFADVLKGGLHQVEADAAAKLLPDLMAQTSLGSLQGVVDKLQASGLGQHVQSWISEGENMGVTADHIVHALGSGQVSEIAQQLGVSPQSAAQFLVQHLPNAVNAAAQAGKL